MEENNLDEKNIEEKDYYELLEISRGASSEVIKNAYRALAKKYHPDKNDMNDESIQEKIRQINIAYETLSDPEKRAEYDAELKEKEASQKENLNFEEDEEEFEEDEKLDPKKKKAIIIFVSIISVIFVSLLAFLIASFVTNPPTLKKNALDEENVETNVEEKVEEPKESEEIEIIEKDDKDYEEEKEDFKVEDNVIEEDLNKIVVDEEPEKEEVSEPNKEDVEEPNDVTTDTKEEVKKEETENDSDTIIESDDGIITIY